MVLLFVEFAPLSEFVEVILGKLQLEQFPVIAGKSISPIKFPKIFTTPNKTFPAILLFAKVIKLADTFASPLWITESPFVFWLAMFSPELADRVKLEPIFASLF